MLKLSGLNSVQSKGKRYYFNNLSQVQSGLLILRSEIPSQVLFKAKERLQQSEADESREVEESFLERENPLLRITSHVSILIMSGQVLNFINEGVG